MSDLVENREGAGNAPRNLPPTRDDFAGPAGGARPRLVGRRRKGCRSGQGRSQSESHQVKPRAKAKRGSISRGGAQWLGWLRYDADGCGFKQYKTTRDRQRFLRNSENRTQYLAIYCKSAHFDGGQARSNLVQVSPGKKFSRGSPLAISFSILGFSRIFEDGKMARPLLDIICLFLPAKFPAYPGIGTKVRLFCSHNCDNDHRFNEV